MKHLVEKLSPNQRNSEPSPLTTAWVVLALLLCFTVTTFSSSLQKSPTYDESIHLFAGYSYLKWGDYRINPEHPPLVKMLAALPLMALDLDTVGLGARQRDRVQRNRDYGWVLANRFVYSDNDAATLFFYAKLVMIAFAIVLGLCIFLWSRELYGIEAAIAALFLYCFDPNIIAHAPIVQTDMPFALFFFAATYFFWRSLKQLTWFNLLTTSVLFALAAITKFSFVLILPIWLVLGVVKVSTTPSLRSAMTLPPLVTGFWRKAGLVTTILLAAAFVGYIAIWLAYGFRYDAVALEHGQLPVVALTTKNPWLRFLVSLSRDYYILPESWVFGISAAFYSLGRTAYLLGEVSNNGFWAYFPVAFLVKTPIPTLFLLLTATGVTILGRENRRSAYFLLIPAAVVFLVAVWARINVGLRHILPVYPFLFVWIGGGVGSLWNSHRRTVKVGILCLAAWLLGSSFLTYPDYLAFFNEIARSQKKRYEILVDSNLDWGQDLIGLKQWMDNHAVDKIQFAYFGTAEPSYYGINAVYLPGTLLPSSPPIVELAPTPKYVAISATYLAGVYLEKPDMYARFRQEDPVAVIGNSLWVYKLNSDSAVADTTGAEPGRNVE
jgi:4-amino-4-deoxy-L-arabinose transferase-like glycosyltransferase